MKLAYATYNDQSSPALEEGEFTVENNATFFYVTIAGLAQDKVRYPVRELCTNAYDTKAPFEVHFPTPFNPTFRVRDFGPGLSREQVRIVYTRIFKSTKDEDNDAVGGLGLGSKSPYAYLIDMASGGKGGGSYNVNSYQNGVVCSYVMSMASNGKPGWKLLAEEPTDQPNGLEVYFAVRREDIARFQDARDVLWSFNPTPKIYPEPNWKTPEIAATGQGWVQYKPTTVPFNCPQVQMGCVMYPIDFNLIEKTNYPWDDTPIVFTAPIGTISVSPSREGLSYDERTIKTLKAITDEFEKDTMIQIQSSLSSDPSYLEACASWGENRWGLGKRLIDYLEQRMRYKTLPVVRNFEFDVLNQGLKICSTYFTNGEMKFENEIKRSRYGDNLLTLYPRRVLERKIVIQRKISRSAERMELAGLTNGAKILWVRHETDAALDRFLGTLDLKRSDCINLDAVTLPKGKRDPKVAHRTCKAWTIVIDEDGYPIGGDHRDEKDRIDIDHDDDKVRLFMQSYAASGYRRGRYRTFDYADGIASVDGINYARADVALLVKSGRLVPGDKVYLFDKVTADKFDFDEIDGWEAFGSVLKDTLLSQVDASKTVQLDGNLESLSSVLQSTYLNAWLEQKLPDDIRDFMQDIVDFRSRDRDPQQEKTNTELQGLKNKITTLFGSDAVVVKTTKASEPFEARFAELKTKYQGLKVFLRSVEAANPYAHYKSNIEKVRQATVVGAFYLNLEGENS